MANTDVETDALILAATEVNRLMREDKIYNVRIEIRFLNPDGDIIRRVEIVDSLDNVLESYTD